MEFAQERGCRYYDPGYARHETSPYEYKKQFAGLEWFDWDGTRERLTKDQEKLFTD